MILSVEVEFEDSGVISFFFSVGFAGELSRIVNLVRFWYFEVFFRLRFWWRGNEWMKGRWSLVMNS